MKMILEWFIPTILEDLLKPGHTSEISLILCSKKSQIFFYCSKPIPSPSLNLFKPLQPAVNSQVRRRMGGTRVLALSRAGMLSLGMQSQLSSG